MPGNSLPLPPPPPAGVNSSTMAYQHGFQYELQIRDQHIHQLQLDNVRLQVKLEQAEKDVKTAMEAMMVALRSGSSKQQTISPTKTITAPRLESETVGTDELRGWTLSNPGNEDGWANEENLANYSYRAEESLLDLDDHEDEQLDRRSLTPKPRGEKGWRMHAPLALLSPFRTPTQTVESDPFVSAGVKPKIMSAMIVPGQPNKSRFRHLFAPPEDEEDKAGLPRPEYSENTVIYAEQTAPIVAYHAGHRQRAMVGPAPKAFEEKLSSEETSHPIKESHPKLHSSDGPPNGCHTHGPRESTDSDQAPFPNIPRGPRGVPYEPGRSGSPRPSTRHNRRHDDEPLPLYWRYGIKYIPAPSEKNIQRTVVIYNLPPQTDVADILARARDVPVLSIKLLPTMGMKGLKSNGSIGKLTTLTALLTFFLDSSAAQFVFDNREDPLLIRGRAAIAKVLETSTFPSGLEGSAFQRPPGRCFSRCIKFQQPGLVAADRFDDVLAGRSYGYRRMGWIVDKTVRREEGGKNMVTVEFASVELARWAMKRIEWDRNFEGCQPRWVFDRDGGGADGRSGRGLLKTRDEDDSSEGEGFGRADGQATAGAAVC